MAEIGHNSKASEPADAGGDVAGLQVLSIIERVERLDEESRALNDDRKEIWSEAKSNGYDVKTLKAVVALRRKPSHERQEEEALLETYLAAIERAEKQRQAANNERDARLAERQDKAKAPPAPARKAEQKPTTAVVRQEPAQNVETVEPSAPEEDMPDVPPGLRRTQPPATDIPDEAFD